MARRFVQLSFLIVVTGSQACQGAPSEEPPIVPIRNMYQQPRYNPQAHSAFFEDGRTMRPPVEGTVAKQMEQDLSVATGWSEQDQSWALTVPTAAVSKVGGMEALVRRGKDRYGIYCSACHGLSGNGDGTVAMRAGGPLKPPTFHTDRIRHMPDGQAFATITHGVRNMPAYRHSIPNADRWAIVGYLRALQVSQGPQAQAMNTPLPQR